jgi:hypothetical protein
MAILSPPRSAWTLDAGAHIGTSRSAESRPRERQQRQRLRAVAGQRDWPPIDSCAAPLTSSIRRRVAQPWIGSRSRRCWNAAISVCSNQQSLIWPDSYDCAPCSCDSSPAASVSPWWNWGLPLACRDRRPVLSPGQGRSPREGSRPGNSPWRSRAVADGPLADGQMVSAPPGRSSHRVDSHASSGHP